MTKKLSLILGLFDQIIHSADNVDIVELFKHLHPKVHKSKAVAISKFLFGKY